MNIIIYGTNKCNDTKKAQRFFKERNISFHFRDLLDKGLAQGELNNISVKIPFEDLIDKESKQFKKRGLEYMNYNIEEELLEDPLLIKTPIVRNGNQFTIGNQPVVWKEWLNN